MNIEDARKVADIVATADGGCSSCVWDLVDMLNDSFPELHFELAERFNNPEIPITVVVSKKP